MSLKTFHIIFIVLAIGVCLFFGLWSCWYHSQHPNKLYLWLGLCTIGFALGLVIYGVKFFRKLRLLDQSK